MAGQAELFLKLEGLEDDEFTSAPIVTLFNPFSSVAHLEGQPPLLIQNENLLMSLILE